MNENTFKERLKLFFIKNQRSNILAYLKESICPSFSKLLACQTCLGKYDCTPGTFDFMSVKTMLCIEDIIYRSPPHLSTLTSKMIPKSWMGGGWSRSLSSS
ncbi:potassium channel subfamily T member 2-like protein [Cricetulus griseus]|nr:potassium channel subfamily T member 2-like protein [Cricetulus griseus]